MVEVLSEKEININIIGQKIIINFWRNYWNNLHYFAYNYPVNPNDEEKSSVLKLFDVMSTDGLPCRKCKQHFKKWIEKNNPINFVNNKDELFKYLVDLHNNVNTQNKKETMTIENAILIYNDEKWDELSINHESMLDLFKKGTVYEFPKIYKEYLIGQLSSLKKQNKNSELEALNKTKTKLISEIKHISKKINNKGKNNNIKNNRVNNRRRANKIKKNVRVR